MTREKLQLNKKFLVVESPIPFEIFCPEQNDGVKRRQGSWQMTIHDLLTTSHYPLNPIYNLELIYDDSLLKENEKVSWYTTDLNLGEALRGIDGQLVTFGDTVLDVEVINNVKETYIKSFGNLKKTYITKLEDIPLNFLVTKYDFFARLSGNEYLQCQNGLVYTANGNTWDTNARQIYGFRIKSGNFQYYLNKSNSQISFSKNLLVEFQGYICGYEL